MLGMSFWIFHQILKGALQTTKSIEGDFCPSIILYYEES